MKVTILYDVDGWAYHRRALALKKYAPLDISVNLVKVREYQGDSDADAVILLDYAYIHTVGLAANPTVPFICTFSADHRRRLASWDRVCRLADWVVALSRERWELRGRHRNCCCIANGVDFDDFGVDRPVETRPDRVLWIGRDSPDDNKGLRAVVGPLIQLAEQEPLTNDLGRLIGGFQCDFRRIPADRIMSTKELRTWYNTGAYVLCASRSEATANTVMEAAACGCVPVSTPVGTLTDWDVDGTNCVIVQDRTPEAFLEGLLRARANRLQLATGALEAVKRYGYRRIVELYWERVVRPLVERQPMEPFCYLDTEGW